MIARAARLLRRWRKSAWISMTLNKCQKSAGLAMGDKIAMRILER